MSSELRTIIGQLNIVEGASQKSTANMAVFEPIFLLPSRRGKEKLYLLLELTGVQQDELYKRLVEIGEREYFNAPGGITAGLRKVIKAINTYLFQENQSAPPKDRRSGGITCLVLRGNDLFIGQAGPALAYVARRKELCRFPPDWWRKETTPLGACSDVEIGFFHHRVRPGDTILVVESVLAESAAPDEVGTALTQEGVDETLSDLEKLAGQGNLSGMVIRIAEERAEAEENIISKQIRGIKWPRLQRFPASLGTVGRRLTSDLAEVGTAIATALAYLLQGTKVLLRRTLPGQEAIPTTPEEDQAFLKGIAVAIPILVTFLVAAVYWQQGRSRQARFEALVQRAGEERALALANLDDETTAREHLQKASSLMAQAEALRGFEEELSRQQEEIQKKLDELDRVNRLYWTGELWTYKELGSDPRRVIVDGETIYVLDKGTAQVYKYFLNEIGTELQEPGESAVVLQEGQEMEGVVVGRLVDMVLVPPKEAVQAAANLLVLESGGKLLKYDPQQGLTLLPLGEERKPQLMSNYFDNLYLLNRQSNQIIRYQPTNDGYGQPEDYFPPSTQVDLSEVVDMAIDGHIYLLHADGRISKFYQGQPVPFAQDELREPLRNTVALFTGPDNEQLYVADAGNGRIVEFSKEGQFIQQFKPQEDRTFRRLKGLFVDEPKKRLYVIDGDKLLIAHISPEGE